MVSTKGHYTTFKEDFQMFRHIMVFIYFFATFLGMAGLSLFWLISKKKVLDNAVQHMSLQKFAFVTFFMGLFTFSIYYREYIAFAPSIAALRLLDYILWLGFVYFWINYLRSLFSDPLMNKLAIVVKGLSLIYVIFWFYATFIVIDHTFNIHIENDRIYLIAMDITYGVLALSVIFLYVIKGKERIKNPLTFGYVLLNSILLAVYTLWGSYRYFEIYTGVYSPIMWIQNPFNATAIFLLFANFFTIVYIYHTDFAESYMRAEGLHPMDDDGAGPLEPGGPMPSLEMKLDLVAANHNLTQREQEIVSLVYKGFSNGEIAAELYISENTVKHHMYNIFRKTGIKNRVELICLVQETLSDL